MELSENEEDPEINLIETGNIREALRCISSEPWKSIFGDD